MRKSGLWKDRAKQLGTDIHALYLAYQHPKTPWYAKLVIALTVAYALSPIDLIPDFIPVLGYLDDLLIVPAGISLSVKLIPEDVMAGCRNLAVVEGMTSRLRWGVSAVILVIWITAGYLMYRLLTPLIL